MSGVIMINDYDYVCCMHNRTDNIQVRNNRITKMDYVLCITYDVSCILLLLYSSNLHDYIVSHLLLPNVVASAQEFGRTPVPQLFQSL